MTSFMKGRGEVYLSFIRYFFHYIFFTKTRQRLLFLAMGGVALSSFSLLILQSIMGGLQRGLIGRSQSIDGQAVIFLKQQDKDFALDLQKLLTEKKFEAYPEYEIELLLRHSNFISPVIVHGVDARYGLPHFLRDKEKGATIMGSDLAQKVRAEYFSQIILISPSHLQSLLGDIPRQVSTSVGDLITTNIPEVDLFQVWTRLSLIQNLIREHSINRMRIFSGGTSATLSELRGDLRERFGDRVELKTWEEQNASLVWALDLENAVMLFLFVAMALLVAIAITSGYMIFFDKIRIDLASFWILGASERKLRQSCVLFIHFVGIVTTLSGLALAHLFLYCLDTYGENIMPDIFVERKIPVHETLKGAMVAFFVPYAISVFFSHFGLKSIMGRKDLFLNKIRSVS